MKLYSPEIEALAGETKIDYAMRAEAAALAYDPRITNSEGGSFDSNIGSRVFANSRGFVGSYRSTYCSISAVPIAVENGSMERDYWYSMARSVSGLEAPEYVGRKAAERAVRRLGGVKVETQRVPVVLDPRMARSLIGDIADAVDGRAIYRNASFLAGKLGEKIASSKMTVTDDGTIPGLFGSQPFDDEGVPTRRTVVIENGVLKSYLLNTYSARKLGLKSTGNASRGVTGNAGIGHGNFYLERGEKTPEQIIAGVKNGFYVTELIGTGVNIVTGDYSRGAAGLWIRDGELAFAVSEVTISRHAAGDVRQHRRNWQRPRISRFDRRADGDDRRDDRCRTLRYRPPALSSLSQSYLFSAFSDGLVSDRSLRLLPPRYLHRRRRVIWPVSRSPTFACRRPRAM